MEEDIKLLRGLIQTYRSCGDEDYPSMVLNFSLHLGEIQAMINVLNELERLQKENNDLRAIRETVRYLEEDGEKDDLYYVVGRGSYLANVLENALNSEKTVHTCLHCGNDTPLYCENCYQELITKNAELQTMLQNRIKYTNELEKDLFENCSNYVVPKQVIRDELKDIELAIAFCENENRFKELIIKKGCLKELLGE